MKHIYKSDRESLYLLPLGLIRKHSRTASMIKEKKIKKKIELGWHYMLDLVWMIEQVKNWPKGATILDAGAGGGLLQFILVDLGFKVISVDFAPRPSPLDIPSIKVMHQSEFNHTYLDYLKSNYKNARKEKNRPITLQSQKEFAELLNKKIPIILYQADLQDMSLCPDNFVDAVVSVSALEHLGREQTERAVKECIRVLKPGGAFLATISAAEKKDWYHHNSMGWCYTESSLRKIFQLPPSVSSNFSNYRQILSELRKPGNILNVELASFYFDSQHNGMPWGVWNPEYIPVAIRKFKTSLNNT